MLNLARDLRYGLRTLTRAPGFTAMSVAVLALGIGVNATVFSLANAVFLRPLPASKPGEIVRVYANRYSNVGYRRYVELRDRNSTLRGLAAFQGQAFGLRVDGEVEHAFGEVVSGNYFTVLGVTPANGRLITPDDDRPGAPPAVVLAHAFWVRRFGASPDVVGRTISLNGQPFTIIGVAPRGFTGVLAPLAGDLWVPLATDSLLRPALDDARRLETMSFHLAGRLRPGIDRASAQAELDTIGRQWRAEAGEPDTSQNAVTVYGSTMLHPEASQPVTIFTAALMTLGALVLLIVCVNVANLVLARAAGRDMEFALRQSLGAARGRLMRQLLTENLILSCAGAVGAVAIAFWTTKLLMSVRIPAPVPLAIDLSLDARVLAFTTIVGVLTTLAFGVLPALTVSRVNLVDALKGIGSGGPRHSRLRSAFLVSQVSMSVLLLIVAGLFIRSFHTAQSMDRGVVTENVLTASVDLETRGYTAARGRDFTRLIRERLLGSPGVVSANIVDIVPLTLSNSTTSMLRDGDTPPAPGQQFPTPMIYTNAVGPGHFETLRISLLSGRDFTDRDVANSPPVAVVNETLARRFWPGKDAVGERLHQVGEANPVPVEVIGVVRDSKYVTVGEQPRPFLYRPLTQQYTARLSFIVRTAGGPEVAAQTLRRELAALDNGLALFNVATLADATSISLLPARIAGNLLAALGLLALVLAALGIYGVLSYLVRARTREIGVRVAVGAPSRTVAGMVVRQAMVWTITGAAIGLSLALVITRFLGSFLYGISSTDPLTFGGASLVLVCVAGIASYVPARRASRVDPLVALRDL
jgi:predicted permease